MTNNHDDGSEQHGTPRRRPRRVTSVEAAVQAHLDHLEGVGPWPDLSQLSEQDRREAATLINLMQTGRGVSATSSTPSLEQLLAGTELESMLQTLAGSDVPVDEAQPVSRSSSRGVQDHRLLAERILSALEGVDARVVLRLEPHPLTGLGVTVRYLDITAVFFAADPDTIASDAAVGALAATVFVQDVTLDYLGVVDPTGPELLTRMLAPSDVSLDRIVIPDDQLTVTWPLPLPAGMALQQMMQFAAPKWGEFTFSHVGGGEIALGDVIAEISRRVLEAETRRPYRGLKNQAYKHFADAAPLLTGLLTAAAIAPTPLNDEGATALVEELMRGAA